MKKRAIKTLYTVYTVEFVVIFFVIAIFLLQNPTTLRLLANKVTKIYNLGYQNLSGNLLTNIKLDTLSYNNRKIADKVMLNFNLLQFLRGEVDIELLELDSVNIKNLKYFLDNISKDLSSSKNSNIPVDIKFDKVILTCLPYKIGKYDIKSIKLILNDFYSDMKTLTAKDILLSIKTNMWDIDLDGNIDKSIFYTKAKVSINNKYFQRFIPGLDFSSLNPIDVILNVNKDFLVGYVETKSNQLFKKGYFADLNLSLKRLTTHAKFDFKKIELDFVTSAIFKSKYAKQIKVDGSFLYDRTHSINYNGNIVIDEFQNIDKNLSKLFKNTKIHFQGNKVGIKAELQSDDLIGSYDSNTSFKTPTIVLYSKELPINSFYKEKFLDKVKFKFKLLSKLDYTKLAKSVIEYNISSNLVDISGNYKVKNQKFDAKLTLSSNSILKEIDKNFHPKTLFPTFTTIKIKKKNIFADLNSSDISSYIKYNLKSHDFNLSLKGYSLKVNSNGKIDNFTFNIDIDTIKDFDNKSQSLYTHDLTKLDGQCSIIGRYKDKKYNYDIDGKWILYNYAKYKFFFIEDFFASMSFKDNNLTIYKYDGEGYILDNNRIFYSNTPSYIEIGKDRNIVNFNINDNIQVNGYLSSDNSSLKIFSPNYHLQEPEANINIYLNLDYKKRLDTSSIKGDIKLLKGTIKYKPKRDYIVNDKDIIFVNENRRKLIDNDLLSLFITITSKDKIKYIFDKNYIYFKSDLTLYKEQKSDLKLYGVLSIVDGIYYTNNKRFSIGNGELMFSGKLLNPYLNLKAYYKNEPYDITILIGGNLETPILNFTSSPPLTQNDILSILLFNTKASNLSNSTSNINPAISIFGNSFAKGITNALGIRLNRVELTTTKEGKVGVEVEKSLSDKTTIVYKNDIIQTIIIRHKINNNLESDFTFSPESSGIDIIYKEER